MTTLNDEKINKNTSPVKYFSVTGLHGAKEKIELKFDSNIKIIVSPNGSGKTSMINILYYILSKNFFKLSQYEFEEIELVFKSGVGLKIKPSDLEFSSPFEDKKIPIYAKRLTERLSQSQVVLIIDLYRNSRDFESLRANKNFQEIRKSTGMLSSDIYKSLQIIDKYAGLNLFGDLIAEKINILNKEFPYEIIYLPTYRRIEEDINVLGLSMEGEVAGSSLINFGMNDVRDKFDAALKSINNSLVNHYNKMSGRMLDELMRGMQSQIFDYEKLGDKKVIAPLLKRFGASILDGTQRDIISLIDSNKIREAEYKPLAYILLRFIEIDEERKKEESYIINFCNIVNSYLSDKAIIYNDDEMTMIISHKNNKLTADNKSIMLSKLSSGEKQLISILANIYLSPKNRFAVLFDEPELSLSMAWQQKLLPDIYKSGRCEFMLAATHSPFIFDNEFEDCADNMIIKRG